MPGPNTAFEAPADPPLRKISLPAGRKGEPLLKADQIQGNVSPGFNKDHQTLLFLKIDDAPSFATWLREFVPRVATMQDVAAFNRLFKSLRRKQHGETAAVQSAWANIAFSFAGLEKLGTPSMKLREFRDRAFTAGMLQRSLDGELGDPVGSETTGDPVNWLIGGPEREADVVLIFAADERSTLNNVVAATVRTLMPSIDAKGATSLSGTTILFRQDGDTLPPPLQGHEHFGFKDGVSQPGMRGGLPDGTLLTPSQNPLDPDQGKPGQDLLWPGEFVFGYRGQDPDQEVSKPGKDPLDTKQRKAPRKFAANGSFLVFRRLRQDVGAFHEFLGRLAARFHVASDLVGARMVGRWPSGAPVVISPESDDADLAADDCRNNNFEFGAEEEDAKSSRLAELPGEVCENVAPPARDPDGLKLPFVGHIRKTYPRDDQSVSIPQLNENSTQTHRLLRRGIPFGPPSGSTFGMPVNDQVDRGLLFLAYQVSIVDQFEFVTKNWANNPNFKDGGTGFDPIIGQNADLSRLRKFSLGLPGETSPIETDKDWVIPTGGGYFFAPSIDSICQLAGLAPPKKAQTRSSRAGKKKKPR